MDKRTSSILQSICLLASLGVTYISFRRGLEEAYAGQGIFLPLHIGGFFVAVGLVLAAVIIRTKTKQ